METSAFPLKRDYILAKVHNQHRATAKEEAIAEFAMAKSELCWASLRCTLERAGIKSTSRMLARKFSVWKVRSRSSFTRGVSESLTRLNQQRSRGSVR
jgi:hypothetical protein